MISVKTVKVPGAITEVMLEDGATVQDALDAAGINGISSSEGLSVNGNTATTSDVLSDGARVVIAKAAKSAACNH